MQHVLREGGALALVQPQFLGADVYKRQVLGPLLMLVADILARLLRAPAELLTGVVVAFIGAPFLLAALRGRARSLA